MIIFFFVEDVFRFIPKDTFFVFLDAWSFLKFHLCSSYGIVSVLFYISQPLSRCWVCFLLAKHFIVMELVIIILVPGIVRSFSSFGGRELVGCIIDLFFYVLPIIFLHSLFFYSLFLVLKRKLFSYLRNLNEFFFSI